MRNLVLAAAVVGCAVGASIGVVFGSGGSSTAIKAASAADWTMRMHPVNTSGRPSKGDNAKRRHRVKVKYLETDPFILPAGEENGATGRCPRKSKAINGYYGSNTNGVVPSYDAVGLSPRKWTIAVFNEGDGSARVFVGIVCLKP